MPRCGPGRLSGYGDLTVCGAAGCRDRAARVAGDIAWMQVSMRRCRNFGWTRGRFLLRRCCNHGRNHLQQCARPGEVLPASGIGEQPVVANAVKAAGQNVQQKATHELVGSERHRLVTRLPRGAVVLPPEGDAAFVECQQPPVRDRLYL